MARPKGSKDKKERINSVNEYIINGEITYIVLQNSYLAIIDTSNLTKIQKYKWFYKKDKDHLYGYVVASYKCKTLRLHRVIMGEENPKNIIDHINHNGLDNREENLRHVDSSKNNMNRSKRKDNTSGTIGVLWSKKVNKWEANISYYNNKKFLGYFDNIEDAVKARKEAEIKYFGEFKYGE